MSISRRQFIIGTAAGLILPSYFDKVFAYFENTGEALLEVPKKAEIEIIASFEMGACDTYELNLGNYRVSYRSFSQSLRPPWSRYERVVRSTNKRPPFRPRSDLA